MLTAYCGAQPEKLREGMFHVVGQAQVRPRTSLGRTVTVSEPTDCDLSPLNYDKSQVKNNPFIGFQTSYTIEIIHLALLYTGVLPVYSDS